MNFQAVREANGNNVVINAIATSIDGITYTTAGKPKQACKFTDTLGELQGVSIYQGTGQPIPLEKQGQTLSINISVKVGQRGGKLYYGGFWNSTAQVRQTTPPQPQQAPQRAAGPTKGDDMVRIRSDALKYAKDLVVADKIPHANLETVTVEFTAFIQTGKWSFSQTKWPEPSGVDGPQDIDEPPVTDSDVPNF